MPVYNEEECIAAVVSSWLDVLRGLNIHFRMIVLNDGSRDGTAEALRPFEGRPDVEIIHKPNSGHGPTILQGYRRACEIAEWVFQCDSDNEMEPGSFPRLWEQRASFDALFGCRAGRVSTRGRRLISAGSRMIIRLLYGRGVEDVNTPYRLMRSALLGPIIRKLAPDSFAPNVMISGELVRRHARICNIPVPHQNRRTGKVSIIKWKLWKAVARSALQTLRQRCRASNTGAS